MLELSVGQIFVVLVIVFLAGILYEKLFRSKGCAIPEDCATCSEEKFCKSANVGEDLCS